MRAVVLLLLLATGVFLGGCHTGKVPNPNDPKDVGALSPETLRRNLRAVTEELADRRAHGEFSSAKYRELVAKAAAELLASLDTDSISPDQAWEYGEILRDAQKWKEAVPVLRLAVDFAKRTKNEDRRINDTLRLAVAEAHLGHVKEAIDLARSTYDAKPGDTAPILISVLLELTPVARDHGHDAELAKLLEEAIPIHERTQVDPNSDAGKAFLTARPFHMRNAWQVVAELYDAAGQHDKAVVALQRAASIPSPSSQGRSPFSKYYGGGRPGTIMR